MFNRRRKTQTVAFSSCGSVYWAPLEHERHTGKSHVLTLDHLGQSTAGAALPSDTDRSNGRAQGKPPCSQDATHDDHPASIWSDSSKHIPFCTYQHTLHFTGSTTYDALACCAPVATIRQDRSVHQAPKGSEQFDLCITQGWPSGSPCLSRRYDLIGERMRDGPLVRSTPYLTREIWRLQTLRPAAFDNCTYTRLEIEVRM